MDLPCATLPGVLPSLRPWLTNAKNRCEYDDIRSYWMAYDAITFLIDIKGYDPSLYDLLTNDEKEQVFRFKPAISRRRYILSRTILKYILSQIPQKRNVAEIVLTRNADGRILVKDKPHVNISLSYYDTSIAISVGKRKLGSDVEGVRPVLDNKITASPIFQVYSCSPGRKRMQDIIHVWTLVESYAKLYDKNPYPLLNRCSPFKDAGFVSYYINQHMIFSLASAQDYISEVLVWLDMLSIEKTCHVPSRHDEKFKA